MVVPVLPGDGSGEVEHVFNIFNQGLRSLVLSTIKAAVSVEKIQIKYQSKVFLNVDDQTAHRYNFIIMFSYTTKPFGYQTTQSAAQFHSRKIRVSSTTANFNHKELNLNRLPELSRSSSSSKSTKLKLTTIEAALSAMSQDLQQLKTDTRESRRFCNYLRQELGQSQLGLAKLQLQGESNKLDKLFKTAKKHDEDRSQYIKVDCDRLREGSKKLIKMMQLLRNRIDNCEAVMGVSSGKEKHLK